MARTETMTCDFCGKAIETVTMKLYAAPVIRGRASTSFMSGYSHYADVCDMCWENEFKSKMQRRKQRPNGGTNGVPKRKKKAKT
jgi:hypothetical protein